MIHHQKPLEHPKTSPRPIKVLVVDDSAFMRFTITKRLNEAEDIQVVGSAHDGEEALKVIPNLNPDVVTLDIEMPHLDGLGTLRQIMAHFPRPVIMLSSLTTDGARETIQALTWGAVDFVAKPASKANIDVVMDDVVAKIRRAAGARVYHIPIRRKARVFSQPLATPGAVRSLRTNDRVVVIGSSTGGPRALNTVISHLPPDLPAAYLVVQHMPVGFTRSLAERLDSISPLTVKEASPGDTIEVGKVLVAPGGFHMLIDTHNKITVNQNPPVHGVRPAVDVTMISAVERFGKKLIGVVLTGMGSDGTNGAALIHGSGGYVIAEDESTCVVWGMPRSVVQANAADEVAPLPGIARAIANAVIT